MKIMTFSELGLSEKLLRAVSAAGYTEPTPVQREAIPLALTGRDLLAGAQTGTGKTAGFVLPILEQLSRERPTGAAPRALVLTPTRELAAQVEESVKTYGKFTGLKSLAVFGGVGIHPQIAGLKRGVDVLVATPGRLLDHQQQRTVDLRRIEILVLDEADRMLDMGFIKDIRRILGYLPKERQNLLFSATFSDEIRELADTLLRDPAHVQVARRNSTVEVISQSVYHVQRDHKRQLLAHLIRTGDWHQVLVFTRTKHGANRLAEQLDRDGITSLAIHGNKSQSARTKALAEFKSGDLRVLVATDIAARGIDIDQLPHVVNFDLPHVAEDYVHRIGRTGRAGATGAAVSLVSRDERSLLRDIERLTKQSLTVKTADDFAPAPVDPSQVEDDDDRGRSSERRAPRGAPRAAHARSQPSRDPSRDPSRGDAPASRQPNAAKGSQVAKKSAPRQAADNAKRPFTKAGAPAQGARKPHSTDPRSAPSKSAPKSGQKAGQKLAGATGETRSTPRNGAERRLAQPRRPAQVGDGGRAALLGNRSRNS